MLGSPAQRTPASSGARPRRCRKGLAPLSRRHSGQALATKSERRQRGQVSAALITCCEWSMLILARWSAVDKVRRTHKLSVWSTGHTTSCDADAVPHGPRWYRPTRASGGAAGRTASSRPRNSARRNQCKDTRSASWRLRSTSLPDNSATSPGLCSPSSKAMTVAVRSSGRAIY